MRAKATPPAMCAPDKSAVSLEQGGHSRPIMRALIQSELADKRISFATPVKVALPRNTSK